MVESWGIMARWLRRSTRPIVEVLRESMEMWPVVGSMSLNLGACQLQATSCVRVSSQRQSECALASTGPSDDSNSFSGFDVQVDIVENERETRTVAHAVVFERQRSMGGPVA